MSIFGYKLEEVRKFLAAAVGIVLIVCTQLLQYSDVLGPKVTAVVTTVLGVATGISVYVVPNTTPAVPTTRSTV